MLPLFLSTISGASIDCPAIQSLGSSLNIGPTIRAQLSGDCCTATGITCTFQRITAITWNNKGMNGVINQTALNSLTELTYLSAHNNRISGSLPTSWPPKMTSIVLATSKLSGVLSEVWPTNLVDLLLELNQLNGTISTPFPSTLRKLNLGANSLQGAIPSNLPQGLYYLHLDSNLFTGALPSDFPRNLEDLRLNENAGIYGDISDIISFNIQSLWLGKGPNYGTSFTGQIIVNNPSEFFIAINQISNIVICNTSRLTTAASCDISQNPLLGNPHISNLTCVQDGLYSTASIVTLSSPRSYHSLCSSAQFKTVTNMTRTMLANQTLEQKTFNTIVVPLPETIITSPIAEFIASPLFFAAIGGFIVLCIFIFAIGRYIKHPKTNSKFGRKNSFGSLNTTAATITGSRTKNKALF